MGGLFEGIFDPVVGSGTGTQNTRPELRVLGPSPRS